MPDTFEEGNFVIVAGEGDEAFVIRKVDDKCGRLALSNGCWEPMDKCTAVPYDKIARVVSFHYKG